MSEYFKDKRIADLVQEHYAFAYVLFSYGVEYYDHVQKTLDELCLEKDLPLEKVVEAYEQIREGHDVNAAGLNLEQMPLELVLQYLRHNHLTFIKKRLPFLKHLLERLHDSGRELPGVPDLLAIFPLFAEALIQHMYEEEDLIFEQVLQLLRQQAWGVHSLYEQFDILNRVSIQQYADLHQDDNGDEMFTIREATHQFTLEGPIQVRVLMEELKAFDNELKVHARIENEIFFPKAIQLEEEMVQDLREQSIWN